MSNGQSSMLGLDIGGTSIEGVALVGGAVAARAELPVTRGAEGVLQTSMRLLAELSERSGRPQGSFDSIGVGVPGHVDRTTGTVRNAFNIDLDGYPLGPALNTLTGLPASVENDVTAAALGAAHLMGLRGTVAYLNLGTGLSAGIVTDGIPMRGAHGFAGEIGHLAIDPRRRRCSCGAEGCLETVASGAALRDWWPGAGGGSVGRELMAAVERGDSEARDALGLLATGAASAIRVLGLVLDPDALVIGGGLRHLGDPLISAITDALRTWGRETPFVGELRLDERIQVLPEGAPAGAVGAALAATA